MDSEPRGAGLRVKCPNCGRICFVTTNQYDPDRTPHGGMVDLKHECASWGLDWLTKPVTVAAAMTCPKCDVSLVRKGRLIVLPPELPSEWKFPATVGPQFVCPTCGKMCKSKAGLLAHQRSHERQKNQT